MTLHRASRNSGFSLIEILVAVVILATGLLALTALQGSLTKASAEAKVRSRIAAFAAGRMEALRNGPYDAIVAGTDTCASTTAPDWVPANVCSDAALGSLTATQTVTTWAGDTAFVAGATPSGPDGAQFKRVTLSVQWTDAQGAGHALRSVSDISPLGFTSNLIPPPEAEGVGGANPKVRQDNPVTAGMIPVALGDGSSSAASNPKPELKQDGQNQRIVATRFNVLNYIPETGGATVIQKRFENELVRCKCTKSAATSTSASIYYKAQWPAIWTGDRYDVYAPKPAADAPGQSVRSAPTSGVTQSDLCTQCCRDHHDSANSVKFDPERTINSATSEVSGTEKYSRDSATGAYTVSDSNYIQACRVIRVDGFWRVAADTYARHFGLLETKPVATIHAKTGSITDGAAGDPSNAKDGYGNFVKAYASGYQGITEAGSGTSPSGADSTFNTMTPSLNAAPVQVLVANVNGDWRYLHARGLYIDHLEAVARKRIQDVLSDTTACPPAATRSARPYDCILPYLPFTTINLTEIANWSAEVGNVLQVNSGNIMSNNPNEPFGGRTKGLAPTTPGTDPDEVIARTLLSNSGLAVYATVNDTDGDGVPDVLLREQFGVDPQDDAQSKEDKQIFDVDGNTNSGLSFYVRSVTSTSTTATYSLPGDSDSCSNQSSDPDGAGPALQTDIKCVTRSTTSPLGGTFNLGNYWSEATPDRGHNVSAVQCTLVGGTGYNGGNNERVATPVFTNYTIASVTAVAGTGTATPAASSVSDGTVNETTVVTFSGASTTSQPTIFAVSYARSPATIDATIDSCTATKAATGNNWTITVNTWNKSWCPTTSGNPLNGCR